LTGVRFIDFADMLGVVEGVHYARFLGADGAYVDEDMVTLRHRQVMLAWMMNDEPISADHGAPLRLIIPFRYGRRSLKAITDIVFGTPALPAPPA
jgi:DMSO/TMAO reductase YedYZ molybdopterin-dependent catalytic subunit